MVTINLLFFQVEGRDISVCVRVRPLMSHEESSGIFGSVLSDHPFVHTLEPKFDVRGEAKTVHTKFDADFVFGPEHDNDEAIFSFTLFSMHIGDMNTGLVWYSSDETCTIAKWSGIKMAFEY